MALKMCRQHSAWARSARVVQQGSASMLLPVLRKEVRTSRLVLLSVLVLIVYLVHVIQKACITHSLTTGCAAGPAQSSALWPCYPAFRKLYLMRKKLLRSR